MADQVRVLVVDDDATFRRTIGRELEHMGFAVRSAGSGEDALVCLRDDAFDVTLLDMRMPGMDGTAVLTTVQREAIPTQVIMLTGHGTVENAVDAMKMGAYDYLIKPCPLDELEVSVRKAWEKGQLLQQNAALRSRLARGTGEGGIVGNSPAIQAVFNLIEQVGPSDSTVLIHGESGVGKELVARAVHETSERASQPFVVIDCTALQESLLESELFGHERGAYTGAGGLKHGLLEVADSGTLFLDEIGELTPPIQAKLLRALETGSFRRVGGTAHVQVDVRVLAATNRNLDELVVDGRFRKDLFFRLNVVSIVVPPLRSRREDIPDLARHFARQCQSPTGGARDVSPEAMALLQAHDWPGNVRELQNTIERASLLTKSDRTVPDDLPENVRAAAPQPREEAGLPRSLREAEGRHIAEVLQGVDGHRASAARILGISERQLYRKLKDHGL